MSVNRVGDRASLRYALGVLVVALGSAGCGARSSLFEGEPAPPDAPTPVCPAAPLGVFSQRFGDADTQTALDLTVDHAGYPVIAGTFGGTLDLGIGHVLHAPPPTFEGPLKPTAWELNGSLFLAKIAPEGCNGFARDLGPIKFATQVYVRTAPDDDLIFAAAYDGTVDLGGGPIFRRVVARLGPSGEHRWSKEVLAPNGVNIARPAVDAMGNVFVAGVFRGNVSLGGVSLGDAAPDVADAFVARIDAAGALAWWKILRLSSLQSDVLPLALAVWPSGQVAVGGYSNIGASTIDLGGGSESMLDFPSGTFVTIFDAAGNHLWDQSLDNFYPNDALVSSAGELKMVYSNWGTDAVFLRRGANGEVVPDTTAIPSEGPTPQMSLGPMGDTLIGGQLSGSGMGGPPMGDDAVVVARVDSAGELVWSRSFSEPPGLFSRYHAVAAFGPQGSVWVAGTFSGGVDFGQGLLTGQGRADIFLARLAP
jgi:hypothetical protein